jgi:hypothetical protein
VACFALEQEIGVQLEWLIKFKLERVAVLLEHALQGLTHGTPVRGSITRAQKVLGIDIALDQPRPTGVMDYEKVKVEKIVFKLRSRIPGGVIASTISHRMNHSYDAH